MGGVCDWVRNEGEDCVCVSWFGSQWWETVCKELRKVDCMDVEIFG